MEIRRASRLHRKLGIDTIRKATQVLVSPFDIPNTLQSKFFDPPVLIYSMLPFNTSFCLRRARCYDLYTQLLACPAKLCQR